MGRRIRDVAQAADGAILVIVDDKNDNLLRLTPSPRSRSLRLNTYEKQLLGA